MPDEPMIDETSDELMEILASRLKPGVSAISRKRLLIIAPSRRWFERYCYEHDVKPSEAKWITSREQLYGWNHDEDKLIVGDWSDVKLIDAAIGLGFLRNYAAFPMVYENEETTDEGVDQA